MKKYTKLHRNSYLDAARDTSIARYIQGVKNTTLFRSTRNLSPAILLVLYLVR